MCETIESIIANISGSKFNFYGPVHGDGNRMGFRIKEQCVPKAGGRRRKPNKHFCTTQCLCSPRQIHTDQTLAWPWPARLTLCWVMTSLRRKRLPFNKPCCLTHWLPSQQHSYNSFRETPLSDVL